MTTTTSGVTVGLEACAVVGGVDTHARTHHSGVCSLTETKLGDIEIPASPAGYRALIEFVATFGVVQMIGVEDTRLSELERGKRPDTLLTARYRRWLTAS